MLINIFKSKTFSVTASKHSGRQDEIPNWWSL